MLNRIEKTGDDYRPRRADGLISRRIKEQFPDKADATLLLEPDISYEVLVAVMDRVRVTERIADETTARLVTRRSVPRNFDRRRAGAELEARAMKFMGRAARMARHHKRHKAEGEINLVSMIDMLTVLVFFLLVYSSQEVEIMPSAKDVQLPQSMAEENARDAVVVIIYGTRDPHGRAEPSAKIADILASKELIIPALKAALENQVEARADRRVGADRRRADRQPRSDDHGATRRFRISC